MGICESEEDDARSRRLNLDTKIIQNRKDEKASTRRSSAVGPSATLADDPRQQVRVTSDSEAVKGSTAVFLVDTVQVDVGELARKGAFPESKKAIQIQTNRIQKAEGASLSRRAPVAVEKKPVRIGVTDDYLWTTDTNAFKQHFKESIKINGEFSQDEEFKSKAWKSAKSKTEDVN